MNACGSLNGLGPHNLIASGTGRRCGFVGVGMIFLEEVGYWGQALCPGYHLVSLSTSFAYKPRYSHLTSACAPSCSLS